MTMSDSKLNEYESIDSAQSESYADDGMMYETQKEEDFIHETQCDDYLSDDHTNTSNSVYEIENQDLENDIQAACTIPLNMTSYMNIKDTDKENQAPRNRSLEGSIVSYDSKVIITVNDLDTSSSREALVDDRNTLVANDVDNNTVISDSKSIDHDNATDAGSTEDDEYDLEEQFMPETQIELVYGMEDDDTTDGTSIDVPVTLASRTDTPPTIEAIFPVAEDRSDAIIEHLTNDGIDEVILNGAIDHDVAQYDAVNPTEDENENDDIMSNATVTSDDDKLDSYDMDTEDEAEDINIGNDHDNLKSIIISSDQSTVATPGVNDDDILHQDSEVVDIPGKAAEAHIMEDKDHDNDMTRNQNDVPSMTTLASQHQPSSNDALSAVNESHAILFVGQDQVIDDDLHDKRIDDITSTSPGINMQQLDVHVPDDIDVPIGEIVTFDDTIAGGEPLVEPLDDMYGGSEKDNHETNTQPTNQFVVYYPLPDSALQEVEHPSGISDLPVDDHKSMVSGDVIVERSLSHESNAMEVDFHGESIINNQSILQPSKQITEHYPTSLATIQEVDHSSSNICDISKDDNKLMIGDIIVDRSSSHDSNATEDDVHRDEPLDLSTHSHDVSHPPSNVIDLSEDGPIIVNRSSPIELNDDDIHKVEYAEPLKISTSLESSPTLTSHNIVVVDLVDDEDEDENDMGDMNIDEEDDEVRSVIRDNEGSYSMYKSAYNVGIDTYHEDDTANLVDRVENEIELQRKPPVIEHNMSDDIEGTEEPIRYQDIEALYDKTQPLLPVPEPVISYHQVLYNIFKDDSNPLCFVVDEEVSSSIVAPPLTISGLGRIGYPLPTQQAAVIMNQYEPSDSKSYIIPSSDIILGEKWKQHALSKLIENIQSKFLLESNTQLQAEVKHVIFIPEHGYLSTQLLLGKHVGVFGTLLMQLPAEHTGGQVIIRHGDQSIAYDFDTDSGDKSYYAVFYADCSLSIQPITSGSSFILIFDLLQTSGIYLPLRSIADLKNINQQVDDAVMQWLHDPLAPMKYAISLESNYQQRATEFSFHGLSSVDQRIYDRVSQFTDQQHQPIFRTFLVKFTLRYESQPKGQRHYRLIDESVDIWANHDGYQDNPTGGLKLAMTEILTPDGSLSYYDTIYMGYDTMPSFFYHDIEADTRSSRGNQYRRFSSYLVVFWPWENDFKIILNSNVMHSIDKLEQDAAIPMISNEENQHLERVSMLLHHISSNPSQVWRHDYDPNITCRLLGLCRSQQHALDLIHVIINNCFGIGSEAVINSLSPIIQQHPWHVFKQSIIQLASSESNIELLIKLVNVVASYEIYCEDMLAIVYDLIMHYPIVSINASLCSLILHFLIKYDTPHQYFNDFIIMLKKSLSLHSHSWILDVIESSSTLSFDTYSTLEELGCDIISSCDIASLDQASFKACITFLHAHDDKSHKKFRYFIVSARIKYTLTIKPWLIDAIESLRGTIDASTYEDLEELIFNMIITTDISTLDINRYHNLILFLSNHNAGSIYIDELLRKSRTQLSLNSSLWLVDLVASLSSANISFYDKIVELLSSLISNANLHALSIATLQAITINLVRLDGGSFTIVHAFIQQLSKQATFTTSVGLMKGVLPLTSTLNYYGNVEIILSPSLQNLVIVAGIRCGISHMINPTDMVQILEYALEQENESFVAALCNQIIIPHCTSALKRILESNIVCNAIQNHHPLMRQLCEMRIEKLIAYKTPDFTWKLPEAIFPYDPMVEQFLRGPLQFMNVTNRFSSITQAREFASYFILDKKFILANKFSATASTRGSAKKSFVTITKTRDYHSITAEKSRVHEQEISRLCKLLAAERRPEAMDQMNTKRQQYDSPVSRASSSSYSPELLDLHQQSYSNHSSRSPSSGMYQGLKVEPDEEPTWDY